jgi:hypothetical protein
VGHLVQESVRALGTVAHEHEVDVEGDLDHMACAVGRLARDHVAQCRSHPRAQAHGDVVG